MTQLCDELKIELPDAFPLKAWQGFLAYGLTFVSQNTDPHSNFVNAMQASAHRFRTADEALIAMASAFAAHPPGSQSSFEGLYHLQRELFVFYTAVSSSVESALFACYVALTERQPAAVPWSDKAAQTEYFYKTLPKHLDKAFGSSPRHALAPRVQNLASAANWKEAQSYKNAMYHRAIPPRAIGVGAPNVMMKYSATRSTPQLLASEADMRARLHWIATQLEGIFLDALAL